MREMQIIIRCTDMDESFDLSVEVKGHVSTLEVVGIFEMAERQYIRSKGTPAIHETPVSHIARAPDGAPWYAHLDGSCGPECHHVRVEDCLMPERPNGD